MPLGKWDEVGNKPDVSHRICIIYVPYYIYNVFMYLFSIVTYNIISVRICVTGIYLLTYNIYST